MSDTNFPQFKFSPSLTAKQFNELQTRWQSSAQGVQTPLLRARGVPAYNTAAGRGTVFVPMQDSTGDVLNLQRLSLRKAEDGSQELTQSVLLKDVEVNGLRHVIGSPSVQDEAILLTKDYLAGASLHQSTGRAVVVAFSESNLEALAGEYKRSFPEVRILVCGEAANRQGAIDQDAKPSATLTDSQVALPSGIDGFAGVTFNDLELQFGPKALKTLVDGALQAQVEREQDYAKVKITWSGPFEIRSDGLNAVRAVVSSTGNPAVFSGGFQESIRGVEKGAIWDTDTFSDQDLAQRRARALANKALEENGPSTQAKSQAVPAKESFVEGLETGPVQSSELDQTLARLKLQYLLANNKYYLRDEHKTMAFEDTGKRLVTLHESTEIARSMVELGKAKGWSSIKLDGSETFKRKAWLEAQLLGVKTAGYKPDAFDQNELEKRRLVQNADRDGAPSNTISQAGASVNRADSAAQAKSQSVRADSQQAPSFSAAAGTPSQQGLPSRLEKDVSAALSDAGFATGSPQALASLEHIAGLAQSPRAFVGRLIEHGPAPYEFKDKAAANYFVKLQTSSGEKTVWGVDIPRSMAESAGQGIKTGDQILLAYVGSRAVTVIDPITGEELETHRNTWCTEKISELPSLAANQSEKPFFGDSAPAPAGSGDGSRSAKEQMLIKILESKGAPLNSIAAIKTNLANPTPSKAPTAQPAGPSL